MTYAEKKREAVWLLDGLRNESRFVYLNDESDADDFELAQDFFSDWSQVFTLAADLALKKAASPTIPPEDLA